MDLLTDDKGNASSMRVAVIGIVTIFMGTWAMVSLNNMALASIDAEAVGLLVGALGVKSWQKQVEGSGK